jgi:restriction system protein
MAVWLVRAGRNGEREDLALEMGLAAIGWDELPSLEPYKAREAILALCQSIYEDEKLNTLRNWAAQLYAFRVRIQKGDLVALPLKQQAAVAFGEVIGDYEHRPDLPSGAAHARKVRWIRTDVPRTAIGTDLLYSLGAFLTVAQIQRNNAEERIRSIIAGGSEAETIEPIAAGDDEDEDVTDALQDLERYARDLISKRISQRFKGCKFERLIEELLRAQGYVTARTTAGADGGVDIVAGRGQMGFDEPRIAVQVKSGEGPKDIKAVRELRGVLEAFNAQRGPFVSWGGFRSSVTSSKRQLFFQVRLWAADEVIDAVLENYNRLSDETKSELPLKRIWTLVPIPESDLD